MKEYNTTNNNRYPMYQTVKRNSTDNTSVVTIVSDKPIEVGDKVIILESSGLFSHIITKCTEQRVARGNHPSEKIFQRLECSYF